MNFPTIAQVISTDHGTHLPAFKGTIKTMFPRKTGDSSKGPYSFENGIFADESGAEIKVTFKNIAKLPYQKGDTLFIQAEKGSKGWDGIQRLDSNYNDKVTPTVEISRKAIISTAPSVNPTSPSMNAAPKPQGALPLPAGGGNRVVPAKQYVLKTALLYRECVKAAAWLINTVDPDIQQGLELQGVATTLFISANKLGYEYEMSAPAEKPVPTPATKPAPEPEPEPTPEPDPMPPHCGPDLDVPF